MIEERLALHAILAEAIATAQKTFASAEMAATEAAKAFKAGLAAFDAPTSEGQLPDSQ